MHQEIKAKSDNFEKDLASTFFKNNPSLNKNYESWKFKELEQLVKALFLENNLPGIKLALKYDSPSEYINPEAKKKLESKEFLEKEMKIDNSYARDSLFQIIQILKKIKTNPERMELEQTNDQQNQGELESKTGKEEDWPKIIFQTQFFTIQKNLEFEITSEQLTIWNQEPKQIIFSFPIRKFKELTAFSLKFDDNNKFSVENSGRNSIEINIDDSNVLLSTDNLEVVFDYTEDKFKYRQDLRLKLLNYNSVADYYKFCTYIQSMKFQEIEMNFTKFQSEMYFGYVMQTNNFFRLPKEEQIYADCKIEYKKDDKAYLQKYQSPYYNKVCHLWLKLEGNKKIDDLIIEKKIKIKLEDWLELVIEKCQNQYTVSLIDISFNY